MPGMRGGEVHLLPRAVPLAEFVVSANRFREPTQDLAERVEVVDARDIAFLDQPTTGDLLQNSGTVFVQKSQMGGGSPVIRGFEASRILLVVDGVRMNNAIYRAGHLQDIMTVDQQTVERIEVISGPASVVYGSDALGGVIHMITRAAPFLDSAGMQVGGSALLRHATANNERTAHVDLSISRKRFSSFTSITASRFGDLRQGRMRQADQPRFNERAFYVERSDGVDRVVRNADPDVQVGTAYDQLGRDGEAAVADRWVHHASAQSAAERQ
jgi:hemoglobin/transferrin/lactoferrin receptor protein